LLKIFLGENEGFIARSGCHENNKECYKVEGQNIIIMGGGMKNNQTFEKGLERFKSLDPKVDIRCR
jgi:hypothetical protein